MNRSTLLRMVVSIQVASLGIGTAAAQEHANPGFTFDGIGAFWAIVTVLETDTDPTQAQWDTFFQAPGYKRLTEQFGRDYFIRALKAVFLPSRSYLAEEMLNEYAERGGFLGWYTPLVLDGFRKASADREWLTHRVQELKSYPYLSMAAEYALEYLPEKTASEYPAVDFVIFNDSRGYTPLIMGLTGNDEPPPSRLECLPRHGHDRHWPFVLLMAHESFHMYRDKLQEISLPGTDHPDYPILWTLDQMVNEGIGDLIHRKRLYYGDGCIVATERAESLRQEQLAQPPTIRVMDKILSEIAADPRLADGLGEQFRSFIPQSGHPTGFYMANIIEEELGGEVIRDVVRNPFRFLTTYNRAAEQSGAAPTLCSKTMAYLESLERQYAQE